MAIENTLLCLGFPLDAVLLHMSCQGHIRLLIHFGSQWLLTSTLVLNSSHGIRSSGGMLYKSLLLT